MRFLAALSAAACFSLAVWALAWGLADLGSVSARVAMERWRNGRTPVEPAAWQAADARLRWARRVNPLAAAYSADLGRLHEWQALQGRLDSPRARAYRRRAAGYFEEAVRKRPTWGLAWANLAKNRLLVDGLTPASSGALRHAIRYAPWEPAVQELIIWLGIALWPDLPSDLQAQVTRTVERALAIDNRVDQIAGVAIQFGWVERLRPLLADARQRAILESRLRAFR